jgi:replicative DNA helicase
MSIPKELEELKTLPQWVCYKLQPDPKPDDPEHKKKLPINPHTGKAAKADDPSTFGSYEDAQEKYYSSNGYLDGVGFELGASGYCGIDLDDVIEDGKLDPRAEEIVKSLDSYTEVSPSGKGLHILTRSAALDKTGYKKEKDDVFVIEVYRPIPKDPLTATKEGEIDGGRYLTVTGKVWGTPKPIAERTDQVKSLINRYFTEKKATPEKKPEPAAQKNTPKPAESSISDSDLLQKMFNSAKGDDITALWSGDMAAYGNDHSRATLALINHLAYWTNGDAGRMDSLYRQSALYESEKIEQGVNKWDRRRGAMTYGEKTIQSALANFTPYTVVSSARKDFSGGIDEGYKAMNENEVPADPKKRRPDNVTEYIDSFLSEDIKNYSVYKDRKTGYSNLDDIQSFYPGLYVLGAISSLGKTTFAHQLGDQLARRGEHVLYFTLEQTRLEMVTKGISRIMCMEDVDTALSSLDIRRGMKSSGLDNAISIYKSLSKNYRVIECNFNITMEDIVKYVTDYIAEYKVKPVVIIDYLQIIPPTDPHQNTKDAVDGHVRAIKKLQSDHELTVLVISSLNRQNYLTPVDFESFKESGGIEYTADVIWGLQLDVMNDDIFNSEKKLKEKRETVRIAKKQRPRKIQLVCLKNRYGISNYECGFNYDPVYDLFMPDYELMPVRSADTPFKD